MEAVSENQYFSFWGKERPDGKKGDKITLGLVDRGGRRKELTVEVTNREAFPMGYELDGKFTENGVRYRVSIIVYQKSSEMEGVKIYYDMAQY